MAACQMVVAAIAQNPTAVPGIHQTLVYVLTPAATARSAAIAATTAADADRASARLCLRDQHLAAAPGRRHVFELNGLAGDLGVYAVASDGTLTRIATVHQSDRLRGLRSTLTAAREVAADHIDLDGDVDDPAGR
jgi:hypothetical protein